MDSHELLPGFFAVGLTLHIPQHDALAFADVHLGFEQALNKQGVLVPPFQYRQVVSHLMQVLGKVKPASIIINGDLKHEFGGISAQEWSEVLSFLDGLREYDLVLVKGNHDNIVGPITSRGGVRAVENHRLGTTLFVHGHKIPKKKELESSETIVIGHEHPCLGLTEEGRTEKVKCFLVGQWKDKNLIVLPSLNYVTEGVDVLTEKLLSPFLTDDIGGFKAYGVEGDKILYFGELELLLSD